MVKLPTNVKNIIHRSCIFIDGDKQKNLCYTINENTPEETNIYVKLPSEYYRPKKSEKIVDDSNDFVNGFKVVQTENGEYAYVRESDNVLLPYRYDIAFNFNEYGFAMVGKDGWVTWIDTAFRYLNVEWRFVAEELGNHRSNFTAWQSISDFSEGDIPLSRVYNGRSHYGKVGYLGIDGIIKEFYQYDGEINEHYYHDVFNFGSEFDKNGCAFADGKMLFAQGYYCSYTDLINICKEKGFINSIREDAEKNFDKKTGKLLKKVKKNEE